MRPKLEESLMLKENYEKINTHRISRWFYIRKILECEVQTLMATSDYVRGVPTATSASMSVRATFGRAAASPDSLDVTTILPLEKKENIIQPS